MQTILCCDYQKESIYHRLARKSATNSVQDVSLKSIRESFSLTENENPDVTLFRLKQQLAGQADCFPIFCDMFAYPSFLKEVLTFARSLALYEISLSALPTDTSMERELKEILSVALSFDLAEKEMAAQKDAVIQALLEEENLKDAVAFEAEPFYAGILETVRSRRPEVCCHSVTEEKGPALLYFADNMRKEIEGCAYDIVQKGKPCNVVLCNCETQLPFVKQVFTRYGIPFSCMEDTLPSKVPSLFKALSLLGLHKDTDTYLEVLKQNALEVPFPKNYLGFLSECLKNPFDSFDLPLRLQSDMYEKEFQARKEFKEWYDAYFASVSSSLSLLKEASNPKTALQNAYLVLRKNPILSDPKERKSALSLRNLLNRLLPLINKEEDVPFILEQLSSLTNITGYEHDFCTVTCLSKPVSEKEVTYVLGCSGSAYPSIPVKNGLFDERYLAKVEGYPSYFERRTLWMNSLEWIPTSGKEIIYSYHAADFQGKETPLSFAISLLLEENTKAMRWPIPQNPGIPLKPHSLRTDYARPLFFKDDDKIHSSISRIERYFWCPYSYFIESGLKVRDTTQAPMDVRNIGNLMHATMEYAVQTYGKNYTSLTKEEIEAFLDPAFTDLCTLYGNQTDTIELCKQRMVDALALRLRQLKYMEDASLTFAPESTEYAFTYAIHPSVILNGKIDRIDTTPSKYRIWDYKSSEHKLQENAIKAGVQLQLPSYMMAMEDQLHKVPYSCGYLSLKQPTASTKAYAATGRGKNKTVDPTNIEDMEVKQQAMLDAEKVFCWYFDAPADITDVKRYFTPSGKVFDYEAVKTAIFELYDLFVNRLTAGDISLSPKEGACAFCSYKPICRFHGLAQKISPLVEAETPFLIRKKGEEES